MCGHTVNSKSSMLQNAYIFNLNWFIFSFLLLEKMCHTFPMHSPALLTWEFCLTGFIFHIFFLIYLLKFYHFAWKCSLRCILMRSESAGCILLPHTRAQSGIYVSHSWHLIPAPMDVQKNKLSSFHQYMRKYRGSRVTEPSCTFHQ